MKSRLLLATLLGLAAHSIAFAQTLPAVKAETGKISVSGLSSGAAMTTQLGVAYSDRVEAIGMMAGPPYLCAQGSSTTAVQVCLTMNVDLWGIPVYNINLAKRDFADATKLIKDTERMAGRDAISSTANISQQKVWVSRGSKDDIVGPNATKAVKDFYTYFKADLSSDTPDVPHTLPTDKDNLGPCDGVHKDHNYVSSCNLDAVGKMFGALKGWQASERGTSKPENLEWFSQSNYTFNMRGNKVTPHSLSMADQARVYVPSACKQGGCKVHVAIHGCQQGEEIPYDLFTRDGGYNEWAEAKNFIVLYPRVVSSDSIKNYAIKNPRGCWDWWGYVPESAVGHTLYAQKGASQMRSIMKMVDALANKPGEK